MTDRQEQFKKELFDLLRRYKVEMSVEYDYGGDAKGINFWSYTQYDDKGNEISDMIDLTVGKSVDGWE